MFWYATFKITHFTPKTFCIRQDKVWYEGWFCLFTGNSEAMEYSGGGHLVTICYRSLCQRVERPIVDLHCSAILSVHYRNMLSSYEYYYLKVQIQFVTPPSANETRDPLLISTALHYTVHIRPVHKNLFPKMPGSFMLHFDVTLGVLLKHRSFALGTTYFTRQNTWGELALIRFGP